MSQLSYTWEAFQNFESTGCNKTFTAAPFVVQWII